MFMFIVSADDSGLISVSSARSWFAVRVLSEREDCSLVGSEEGPEVGSLCDCDGGGCDCCCVEGSGLAEVGSAMVAAHVKVWSAVRQPRRRWNVNVRERASE